ncbi:MAG: TssQ family T6SS-associated lipoprotein [Betaproteobacteria bacterium]
MSPIRIHCLSQAWTVAVLLALTGAGCSAPIVQEPVEPPKDVAPSRSTRQPEPAKEPVVPPKAQPPRVQTQAKGQQELDRGIKSYEEGEYKTSARQLQAALDLGLEAKRDQATAHKYLAFITCVSGREKSCRVEFQKALDADPKFDLEPAEAGHPIWGPVLRSVKAERAAKAKPK